MPHYRFAAEPEAGAAARQAVGHLSSLDPAELHVAKLLTTELISNGVEHAASGRPGSLQLDLALSDALLRVEVRDEGPGFVPSPRVADSPLDSRWGLHMVDHLADRWGVTHGPPTLVWFELDRPRPA